MTDPNAPASGTGGPATADESPQEEVAAFDVEEILDRVDRDQRRRGDRGRHDERVREELCRRLADDPWIDATEIEVRVVAGEVTLSGSVDSRSIRRRAEDLAEQVSGVSYVQNDLRARNPFYNERDRQAPV